MILDQFGAPIKIEKKALTGEMATFLSATGSDIDIMPDPDPVLKKRGDDAKVLEALEADDQVTMVMQLRKRKITNKRDYDYTPGQPSKGEPPKKPAIELCRNLTRDLAQINLKTVFNASLSAPFYGYSVFELMWGADGNRMRLLDIQEKPREWFGFDGKGKLFFYENGQQKPVPWGKFLVARHEPTYKNPYGLRLLSRCLFPVAFKNGGVQWSLKFLEKYSIPWQVAKAPQNYDDKERYKLASSLSEMAQEAVAVLPHGAEHEIVAVNSKGGTEGLISFLNFWNAAISKVLSCQTQSSEIAGSGTYASSRTHYDVLEDVVQSDEMLVCEVMNDLGGIYTLVNGSNEYPPVFSFNEATDYLAQAELDKKRFDVGARFTKAHFERLGLDEKEFEIVDPMTQDSQAPQRTKTEKRELAEHERQEALEGLHQDYLDTFVKEHLPDAVKANEATVASIEDAVKKAKDWQELEQSLVDLAGQDLSQDDLFGFLEAALFNTELFGRFAVATEIKEDGEE